MFYNTLSESLTSTGISDLPMIFGGVGYGQTLSAAHDGVFFSVTRMDDGRYEKAIFYTTQMDNFQKIA